MLISQDLKHCHGQRGYSWGPCQQIITGGDYELECQGVRVECGGEHRISWRTKMLFSFDGHPSKGTVGTLTVEADNVPPSVRAMLLDGDRCTTAEITIGAFRNFTGVKIPPGAYILGSTAGKDGPVIFKVAPVKKSEVDTFIASERTQWRESMAPTS